MDRASAEPHNPKRDAIGRIGKSTGEIELHFTPGACTGQSRANHLESKLRLPDRASKAVRPAENVRSVHEAGNIRSSHIAAVLEKIDERDPRQSHAIFRRTFN